MAIKARQKGRAPKGRSGSFQRKLTWREVELAFDHFFEIGLEGPEVERIMLRFKRARSQLLPIFSAMVVSPFEREREIALAILARMGGQATARMLATVLADETIHPPLKLGVQRLYDELAPLLGTDDEDENDELVARPRDGVDDDDDVERTPSDEADTDTADEQAPDRAAVHPAPRRRRGRSRGQQAAGAAAEADPTAAGAAESSPTADAAPAEGTPAATDLAPPEPSVFSGDPAKLLPYLAGPVEPLLKVFADVPLAKRLSFVDRSSRLTDPAILNFLRPLLRSDQLALVQSVLRAIGQLGFPEALPDVEAVAADAARKRLKQRAERVREQLLAAQGEAPAAAGAVSDATTVTAAASAAAGEAPAEEMPRPKPQPRQRRRIAAAAAAGESGEAAASEAVPATSNEAPPDRRPARSRSGQGAAVGTLSASDYGIVAPPVPTLWAPPGQPLEAPDKLPRLGACFASGVGLGGLQRLLVFRQSVANGAGDGWDCLELRVHDGLGWLDYRFHRGGGAEVIKQFKTAAEGALVEVTVGYVRGRVNEAIEVLKAAGRPLPEQSELVLQYVGTSRRPELAMALPESAEPLDQPTVDALLAHPLFGDWRATLTPDGQAIALWQETIGKRSASRVRRRLIDEVAAAWCQQGIVPQVITQLARQALLLQRSGAADLATAALAAAATLEADTRHPERHRLLRELVYQGFQAGLAEAPARPAPATTTAPPPTTTARSPRFVHARSAFQRGLRRR